MTATMRASLLAGYVGKIKAHPTKRANGASALDFGYGHSAAQPAPAPAATTAPAATRAPAATTAPAAPAATRQLALPTPAPTFTPLPVTAMVKMVEDAINVGAKEIGPIQGVGDPWLLGSPRVSRASVTFMETLVVSAPNGTLVPRLARDWTISDDGLLRTFQLEEGVQFHDGYGEMTAEDVVWTLLRGSKEGSKFGRAAVLAGLVQPPNNQLTVVDDHTFTLATETPRFDLLFTLRSPYAAGIPIQSKAAFDDGRLDEPVGTAPWQFVEASTGAFWDMEAFEDHWRKVPFFRNLTFWEIPEESTRLASYQTGELDTGEMSFQSLEELAKTPEMKFNKAEEGAQFGMHLFGQFYTVDRPGYRPEFAWVSSDPDINSEEWARARKVRLALAIDREAIVDSLLAGEGRVQHYWMDAGHPVFDPLKTEDPEPFKYDLDRAKALLDEAGYSAGFDIPVVCYTRGVPSEIQTCEAVATMWEALGLNTSISTTPYGTVRPTIFDRSIEGIVGHGRMGTYPEPMALWPNAIKTHEGFGWNSGLEHPIIDELLALASSQVDPAERFETSREIQRFIQDNVTHIPVFAVNIIFPVGPKIDVWPLLGGDKAFINSLEFTPPRK